MKFVSVLWFGSIAFIVASMGTFLALASFVLRDPEVFKYHPRRTLRKVLIHLTIRIAQLLRNVGSGFKEFGIRSGDGLRSFVILMANWVRIAGRLIAISLVSALGSISFSFRILGKLLSDWRRRIRQPKIKLEPYPVETIVEKEVEKIIEVEKIVEREVERIVEVEKIVFKEVPKEIIRKELVYVPLYSAEKGQILADAGVFRSLISVPEDSRTSPGEEYVSPVEEEALEGSKPKSPKDSTNSSSGSG